MGQFLLVQIPVQADQAWEEGLGMACAGTTNPTLSWVRSLLWSLSSFIPFNPFPAPPLNPWAGLTCSRGPSNETPVHLRWHSSKMLYGTFATVHASKMCVPLEQVHCRIVYQPELGKGTSVSAKNLGNQASRETLLHQAQAESPGLNLYSPRTPLGLCWMKLYLACLHSAHCYCQTLLFTTLKTFLEDEKKENTLLYLMDRVYMMGRCESALARSASQISGTVLTARKINSLNIKCK